MRQKETKNLCESKHCGFPQIPGLDAMKIYNESDNRRYKANGCFNRPIHLGRWQVRNLCDIKSFGKTINTFNNKLATFDF